METFVPDMLEMVGIVFSLGYVLCNIRQHQATWLCGFISSIIYVSVFIGGGLYASALLSATSALSMMYGWYIWRKGSSEGTPVLQVTTYTTGQRCILLLVCLVLSGLVYVIVSYFEGASLLWGDAVIAGASLLGFFAAARKKLETWYIWIGVNILAVSIYSLSALYPTAVLYSLFLVLAFSGLRTWKKDMASAYI